MKHVKESLNEFNDAKFFNHLFETDEDETVEDEKTPEEDLDIDTEEDTADDSKEKAKQIAALEKQGMSVIKKVQKNWGDFKKTAGDKMQNYRDFWAEQKNADETIGQKGLFYNLYNSDYIVGVVKSASGKAELKVYNTSVEDKKEFESFISSNKGVVKLFFDFFKGDVEATMKEVIKNHKIAIKNKKAADVIQQKTDTDASKKAKLDAFLGE